LYSPVHLASQQGLGTASNSLAPLAWAKESLHNCFSAQGLIISRAFLLWRASPLVPAVSNHPQIDIEKREVGCSQALSLP
jgi:hypothetical protein